MDHPHVLGLSLGSILAIALHARYPTVARSLVLASAYAGWAGSLPPAEVQRRIRLTLRDLDRPAHDVARSPQSTHDQGGQFRGHQWAELVATSGQVCWPPVGRSRWPLTSIELEHLRWSTGLSARAERKCFAKGSK